MSSFNLNQLFAQTPFRQWGRGILRPILRRFGHNSQPRPFSQFISFKQTLAAARAAGLPVGEYLERRHLEGVRTARDQTMDGLDSLGVFSRPIERICELGPGSGRYLERITARCQPRLYEIYETSTEWRKWLVERHGVIARNCDGKTLAETESGSVDLVHANKVFPGLPLLVTSSYFQEMARVAHDGGWVVFDIMTEACFTPAHLDAWFAADPWAWEWSPNMIARDYAIGVFAKRGLSLVGSFEVPLFPAITECMVFRKTPAASHMPTAR
jgi:hypothetical protein